VNRRSWRRKNIYIYIYG